MLLVFFPLRSTSHSVAGSSESFQGHTLRKWKCSCRVHFNLTYLLNPYEPSLAMAVNYTQLPNAKTHAELDLWDRQKINTWIHNMTPVCDEFCEGNKLWWDFPYWRGLDKVLLGETHLRRSLQGIEGKWGCQNGALEGGRKEEQLGASLIHSASDEKDFKRLQVSKFYKCVMSCLGLHAQV